MEKMSKIIVVVFALLGNSVYADTLAIPDQSYTNVDMPARGISKDAVISKYGEPDSTDGPTGDPPIYYWEYPDFTVYFEHEHVIHTVNKRKSALKIVQ